MRKRKLAYRLRRAARRACRRGIIAAIILRQRREAELAFNTDLQRQLNRQLFGADYEPSWDEIRAGACNALLSARVTTSGTPEEIQLAIRRIYTHDAMQRLPDLGCGNAPGAVEQGMRAPVLIEGGVDATPSCQIE